jgi:hypothetical protein
MLISPPSERRSEDHSQPAKNHSSRFDVEGTMSKATTAIVNLLAVASVGVLSVSLQAQIAAHFSGAQSPLGSRLSSPGGAAVDCGGSVYIADTGNSRVLIETLSSGTYTPVSRQTGCGRSAL